MSNVWIKLNREELKELMSPNTAISALSRAPVRQSANRALRKVFARPPEHRTLGDSFEDERGRIQDLIVGAPIDSVTRITTVKGAVRGNHLHKLTIQWTYVLTGCLLMANGATEVSVGPGEMVVHRPETPHAWKAIEDTDCLVFTLGPRSGEQYESDTYRLEKPLL